MGSRTALVVVIGAAFLLGSAALAVASFISGATATQTIGSATLGAPTGLTAVPSGHNVVLNWSAGTNGTGYEVDAVNNGTSSNCSSVTFSSLATPVATTYTDSGRFTPQGTYECYRVETARGNWLSTASNPTAAAQLGVVVSSVAYTSGGSAGTISSGDKIVLTFNQAISTASGPAVGDTVCTLTGSNTIVVGSTAASGACTTTAATVAVGTLVGGTVSKTSRFNSTYAWSAGNTVLTVTIGSLVSGTAPAVSGSQVLTVTTTATALLSATGSYNTCSSNTGGGNCTPTATGTF